MTAIPLESSRLHRALSARAAGIPGARDSAFFELLNLAAKREGVIKLGMGEPDIRTPPHIVEAVKQALDRGLTTYTNPAGLPELREAIADKLARDNGLTYDPDDEIIVTTGAQEALAVVMQTLLDPGDEVLIASPYYGAYAGNILLAGGVPVPVPIHEDDDFQLHAADVEARITERTKLFAIITPSNPTASGLTGETLESLAKVAIEHDLPVLSDELYEKVVYDGFEHVSIASFDGMRERTIVVNGFSKSYSMTGFRVGYMSGAADYIQSALEPRHCFSISSPTPFQYGALAALTGTQAHFGPMMEEYTRRRNAMAAVFDELGVTYSMPRGAFYFWANISGSGVSSYEFCHRALVDHAILFFPGSMYGDEGEGYARISFLAPPEKLAEALERFARLYRECQSAL